MTSTKPEWSKDTITYFWSSDVDWLTLRSFGSSVEITVLGRAADHFFSENIKFI